MSTIIYFFSGTGNSLKVAKDLQALIPDCTIETIASTLNQNKIVINSKKVGIVFPVYWVGPPSIVVDFVKKIVAPQETYFFAVNTFAAYNGQSVWMVNEILKEKGLALNAGTSIWMPGNNQIHYKPMPKLLQKIQFKKEKKNVYKFAQIINSEKTIPIRKNSNSPESVISKVYRPFINECKSSDKNFWVDADCNNCKLCEKICPTKNIQISIKGIEWKHNCVGCLACMQWCPKQAIQYKKKTLHKKRYQHPDIKVNELIVSK